MPGKKLENVNPNRMELLILRRRINLAEKGHKLLSEKRDAMVMQFMKLLQSYEETRDQTLDKLQAAYDTLVQAEMLMGEIRLEDLSNRIPPVEDLKLTTRNIIGVRIPALEEIRLAPMDDFQYGLLDTNAKLDDAVMKYREIVPEILRLSITEAALEKIAREIEKTKRRVNALEYVFIPRLKATRRYIEMQLSERERQDFFRRKRIKELLMKEV
jgi:V/A-type H+-transporting ATPase subunit D